MRGRIYEPATRRGPHGAADRRRPRQGHRRAAADEAGARSRRRRHAGRHRRDRRICCTTASRPKLTDALEDAIVWVAAETRAGARRQARCVRRQLRRRPVDRRRRAAARPRRTSPTWCRSAATAACPTWCASSAPACSPTAPSAKPHDYGVVVALMNTAEQVVPAEQVAPLRAAIMSIHARPAPGHGRPKAAAARVHAHAGDDRRAARAGAHADGLRQHAERRRRSGRSLLPHTERVHQRSGALAGEIAPAVDGARVPAARRRRQRRAGDRVAAAGQRARAAPRRSTCW